MIKVFEILKDIKDFKIFLNLFNFHVRKFANKN
jgi:hypothetical protein